MFRFAKLPPYSGNPLVGQLPFIGLWGASFIDALRWLGYPVTRRRYLTSPDPSMKSPWPLMRRPALRSSGADEQRPSKAARSTRMCHGPPSARTANSTAVTIWASLASTPASRRWLLRNPTPQFKTLASIFLVHCLERSRPCRCCCCRAVRGSCRGRSCGHSARQPIQPRKYRRQAALSLYHRLVGAGAQRGG